MGRGKRWRTLVWLAAVVGFAACGSRSTLLGEAQDDDLRQTQTVGDGSLSSGLAGATSSLTTGTGGTGSAQASVTSSVSSSALSTSGGGVTGTTATGGSGGSGGDDTAAGGAPPQRALDKLDILLAVDDSRSMADKQRLLQTAVPDLVGRLANPLCVDADRTPYPSLTPSAGKPCPAGPSGMQLEREFLPVEDVHVGFVTSSLGAAGATTEKASDQAHLVGSLRTGLPGATPEGFLAWGPDVPQSKFEEQVAAMMAAVGELGEGFESPLEAWLRFLVDPEPYAWLAKVPCTDLSSRSCVERGGTDWEVLEQRRAFLRPDSVLVIIVLSDEDDCSAAPEGRNWEVLQTPNAIARGTSICEVDPEDPCCVSCADPTPAGCEPDPICDPSTRYSQDQPNLRCFEQKRRFGRDALFPVERYHTALTERLLCPERLDLSGSDDCSRAVENPLFFDAKARKATARTPAAVFLTFIVGVPWQDLARDPSALADPEVEGLVYKSSSELSRDGAWELLIGDSLNPPGDPWMLQSVTPRSGTHPITGETLAGAEAWPLANSINGHDRDVQRLDDLQYSCTFQLPEPRECLTSATACDCAEPQPQWLPGFSENSPLCQDPVSGEYSTLQRAGKAYPGQRHVQLAKKLGDNAVLSSICTRNSRDPSRIDYGYRPTVAALVERIAPVLKQPE